VESPEPMKIPISLDDTLGALHQLVDIISDKPMVVPWDSDVFGRDGDILMYLHKQDVLEFGSSTEELNITLIQLWMM